MVVDAGRRWATFWSDKISGETLTLTWELSCEEARWSARISTTASVYLPFLPCATNRLKQSMNIANGLSPRISEPS